jgi:beta-glucanase (GH16 family)
MKSYIKFTSAVFLFLSTINLSFAQEWTLVFEDNFETDGAVNSENWFHQTLLPNGYSWYNNESQHYTNRIENSYAEEGLLKLVAIKENFTDQGHTKSYTSARLNSKFAFKYGKVEVRAKLPFGQGTWPAIWTLGKNIIEPGGYWTNEGYGTTSWPDCGEIDIMEHWGSNQNFVQSATHTPSSYGGTINHGGQWVTTASSELHIYGLEWTAEKLIFSVDGEVHYTYNPPIKNNETWPFDEEQYLLLNIAIAPDIAPNFVQSALEIDYVRVYQTGEDNTGGGPTDISGCLDANALNYNANASIQAQDQYGNLLCQYASCNYVPANGCMYQNAFAEWHAFFNAADCSSFGGTPCEGMPEDVSGCIDVNAVNFNANASIQLLDQYGDLVCTYTSCEYTPYQGCLYSNSFAAWNTYFNASDCIGYGGTPCENGPEDINGCMDESATDFNANANIQALDQWDNILCTYSSCDLVPEEGCMYANAFAAWHPNFNAVDCSNYGGTPCESEPEIIEGCMDIEAINFEGSATNEDGSCQYECHVNWNVEVTDQNHSIFIEGDWIDLNGNLLVEGSAVGVFFQNQNGDFVCAGYSLYAEGLVQIAVMGDDATTEGIDGLAAEQQFVFRVWNASTCQEYSAVSNYTSGPETYTANGITFVNSVEAIPFGLHEQTIDLTLGWSLFSTYMIPTNQNITYVLSPIIENVIIAKNYLGLAYLPEFDFNGIGTIEIGQGYQIKTALALELTIEGSQIIPEEIQIDLISGWSIIGYLRTEEAEANLVLADLVAEGNLVIAKNSSGQAYLPEWEFNGIGMMKPGEGYQIKTNSTGTIQYISNNSSY